LSEEFKQKSGELSYNEISENKLENNQLENNII
jgi:hypothetical protein